MAFKWIEVKGRDRYTGVTQSIDKITHTHTHSQLSFLYKKKLTILEDNFCPPQSQQQSRTVKDKKGKMKKSGQQEIGRTTTTE